MAGNVREDAKVGTTRMLAEPRAPGAGAGATAGKTPDVVLEERYAAIASKRDVQFAKYTEWVSGLSDVERKSIVEGGSSLGIDVDVASGHIRTSSDFEAKRPRLCFDLVYCRHGKTGGNTEPRVYQGFVDEPMNALNDVGKGQAQVAAERMRDLQIKVDLIIMSPLARAKSTGQAFVDLCPDLVEKVEVWDDTAEMHFGEWDNKMVKDMDDADVCHLFYLDQNALVKSERPYVVPATGERIDGETFVDTMVCVCCSVDMFPCYNVCLACYITLTQTYNFPDPGADGQDGS